MIITIDGPAASGKSTTAKAVAAALGFRHVDSGALYRAATAARARLGGSPEAWTEADVIAAAAAVEYAPVAGGFEPRIDGVAVDDDLRTPSVTLSVPRVAQMAAVRAWVKAHVRAAADTHDAVVDGRDMGTSAFPDAELKIYLVADSWQRARRRLLQRNNVTPGDDEIADEMASLIERDRRDAVQLVQAADAVIVDTTSVTQEEQVSHIVALANALRRG